MKKITGLTEEGDKPLVGDKLFYSRIRLTISETRPGAMGVVCPAPFNVNNETVEPLWHCSNDSISVVNLPNLSLSTTELSLQLLKVMSFCKAFSAC